MKSSQRGQKDNSTVEKYLLIMASANTKTNTSSCDGVPFLFFFIIEWLVLFVFIYGFLLDCFLSSHYYEMPKFHILQNILGNWCMKIYENSVIHGSYQWRFTLVSLSYT